MLSIYVKVKGAKKFKLYKELSSMNEAVLTMQEIEEHKYKYDEIKFIA